ncbi:MAG: hypothetical protein WBA16_04775 [Nonlabens sp.]
MKLWCLLIVMSFCTNFQAQVLQHGMLQYEEAHFDTKNDPLESLEDLRKANPDHFKALAQSMLQGDQALMRFSKTYYFFPDTLLVYGPGPNTVYVLSSGDQISQEKSTGAIIRKKLTKSSKNSSGITKTDYVFSIPNDVKSFGDVKAHKVVAIQYIDYPTGETERYTRELYMDSTIEIPLHYYEFMNLDVPTDHSGLIMECTTTSKSLNTYTTKFTLQKKDFAAQDSELLEFTKKK